VNDLIWPIAEGSIASSGLVTGPTGWFNEQAARPTADRSRAMPPIRTLVICLLGGSALAQSPDEYRHPIGLFADMAADTVTSDLFNHFEPLPGLWFEAVDPVPGYDLFLDCRDIAVADLDGDGLNDVVLAAGMVAGDPPSRLLWGRPDGRFEPAAPATLPQYMSRVVRADLDGDGRTDLVAIVLSGGYRNPRHDPTWDLAQPHREVTVLRNRGDRTFAAHPLGIPAVDVTVADYDGDGWLDLIAVVPAADQIALATVVVLRGGPDGLQLVHEVGPPVAGYRHPRLWSVDLLQTGRPTPAIMGHETLDPWPAAYLLDDPLGAPVWRRLDLPLDGAVAPPALADVENEGALALFIGLSDYAGGRNRLLVRNQPAGSERAVQAGQEAVPSWRDIGREAGLWAGYHYTIGTAWGDLDNDGLIDLWQCRAFAEGRDTQSQLYWNRGAARYVNATAALSRPAAPSSHRAVWIDTDGDGRLDLLAAFRTYYTETMPIERCRPLLYRNLSEAGNWLQIRLAGRPPNTDAIGATVRAWVGGRPRWRHLDDGSTSGGACPPLVLHYGLGTATQADSVVVRWPGGEQQVWRDLAAGQLHVLVQEP
jgi:hypothetical protein